MGHKLKTLIFFLLSVIAANTSFAQTDGANMEIDYSNDGRGWVFGLNVGVY